MRVSRFLKIAAGVTTLALIYIHIQMQIFTLAYQGKFKEKQIKKAIEENGYLIYKTLTLKSASNLGGKMFADNSSMKFADPKKVVQVAMPKAKTKMGMISKKSKPEKSNYLLTLISQRSQAEAKQE